MFRDIRYPPDAPQVGERVRTKKARWGRKKIVGTVIECHEGYDDILDGERVTSEPWITFRPEKLPPQWPYSNNDVCALDYNEVESAEEKKNVCGG